VSGAQWAYAALVVTVPVAVVSITQLFIFVFALRGASPEQRSTIIRALATYNAAQKRRLTNRE
jgi:hypothetical protein